MKNMLIAAAAALTFVAPLASTAAYADPPRQTQHRDNDRNDRSNSDRNDRNDNNRRGNTQRQAWNQSRDNGYYANGRFNYGPPSAAVQRQADYRPGWQNWRRGERLPSYYRSHLRQVDYRREHLRAPARGQQYVRDDRGNTLLVGIATGVILSVILSQ